MIDKLLKALKDWRLYVVFVTFLIFILVISPETVVAIQNFIGGFIHG